MNEPVSACRLHELSRQLAEALRNGDRTYLELLEERASMIRKLACADPLTVSPDALSDLRRSLNWGEEAMESLRELRETALQEFSSARASQLLLSGLSAGNPIQYDGLELKA